MAGARKFGDRLPKLEYERLVGLVLLYLALLTTFHFFAADTKAAVFETVATGRGGGLLGAAILWTILGALGTLGAAVLLVAWWIISIVLIAGLAVPELLMLGAGLARRLRGQPVERQLPLPNMGEPALRSAVTAEPIAAPAAVAADDRPAGAGPKAAAAAALASRLAPPPPVAARRSEAALFPPPASAPAPSYDQPLVIGGDQPWVLPEVADMLDAGTESSADDEYDRQRANMIETHPGRLWRAGESGGGQPRPDHHPVRRRAGFRRAAQRQEDQGQGRQDRRRWPTTWRWRSRRHSVRIEAPVPGKGFVGIEVPNTETSLVALRDVMESRRTSTSSRAGCAWGWARTCRAPPSPPGWTACRTCSSPAPPARARACASTPSSPACCCRTRPTI